MRRRIQVRAYIATMLYVLVTLVILIGEVSADSLSTNILHDKWKFEFGGFSQNAKLKISAGPTGEVPDTLDLNTLGANEHDTSIWLAGRWRINRRWHLGLSFVEVDRVGFSTSTEDFVFGEPPEEVNVTIGASVNSAFNTRYYILQGGYTLVETNRANFGIGAGLHVMDMSATVAAEVVIDGVITDLGTGTSNSTAPLPNIYVYGEYTFTPKVAMTGTVSWFGLRIGQYDGELVSLNANVEYRPWKNIGIGIGYTQVNLNLTVDGVDSTLNFEIDASGPRIYLTASLGNVGRR